MYVDLIIVDVLELTFFIKLYQEILMRTLVINFQQK